jgi:uncharacterized membrane protein
MLAAGLWIAALTYSVPPATSWRTVAETVEPSDLGFGMACTCMSAVLLGALAMLVASWLRASRWGLLTRIIAALLATLVVVGAVTATVMTVWAPLTPVVTPSY